MAKKALITGITGQDGSYLAEFLLEKGYEVHGLIRRASTFNRERIEHLHKYKDKTFFLHYADMAETYSLHLILNKVKPDEIYNLAAQSHVKISFDQPEYTADVVGTGAMRLFATVQQLGLKSKIYQASSSEMFGKVQAVPQTETTPFYPRSPYAVSKVFAHWAGINMRESYDMFISNGILFNHESPRRGENFVTRKITRTATRIKMGLEDKLVLGNMDSKRDWGYAKEYVEAMWLMLQQDKPDDFVIATNETHTVQEFVEETFKCLDLDWKKYVETNPKFIRPAEVDLLIGDASKAKRILKWEPKTKFKELVKIMVEADLELAKKELILSQSK